ncbi:sodium- and chloride-dependent neutral and basic amino acid transporter B(0+)-like [Amblyomma americanum]
MYAVVMGVLVVPMLHMEAILGQFRHCGNRGALECSPAFIGLSYTMAYFHVATSVSDALSMSYATLYLLGSSLDPLPWSACGGMNASACYVLEALGSWKLATERSLYSVGCSRSFLRLAGWNKFFGDVRCVAPILAWTNFATTLMSTAMVFLLLFLVSEKTDTELDAYFEPKDAHFVSVVQALLFLEPERSFSVLYFSLMFCTGICDLIIMQEVVLEVLMVDFPAVAERTVVSRAALCLLLYALSMPLCTGAGPYLADLLDYNFKGSLYLILNLIEVLVLTRVYGTRRISSGSNQQTNATYLPKAC